MKAARSSWPGDVKAGWSLWLRDMKAVRSSWLAVLAVAGGVFLMGCQTQGKSMTAQQRGNIPQDFLDGHAMLTCDMSCEWAWLRQRGDVNTLFIEQQWMALAIRVIEIGRQEDLAYYWLGRAAEEQGALVAADRYYRLSIQLYDDTYANFHCRTREGSPGGCFGINLPGELPARVARIETLLNRAVRQNAVPPPNVPRPSPTSRSGTIDIPPPVNAPR